MDIDQPVAPARDEIAAQEPHESGEAHELDPGLAERPVERGVERLARQHNRGAG